MPPKKKVTPDPLITLEEAANLLLLPRPHADKAGAFETTPFRIRQRRAILRLIRAGNLTGVKYAATWRVYESSVLGLMAHGADYDRAEDPSIHEKTGEMCQPSYPDSPEESEVTLSMDHNSFGATQDES